jgi:hypothetical protein
MKTALKHPPLGAIDANPLHLAHAAGLFDGDGCVLISKQHQAGRKHPTYRLCLSLVQNCHKTITHFQSVLGLQACLVEVRRTRQQNRQVYDLRYDGIHAVRALQLLQPYLVRKAVEAQVAIKFWSDCQMGVLPGCSGMPDAVWKARYRFYKKLQKLK